MCILLKLDYAKFGVSNLNFSKVIEEKPLWVWLDTPHLGKGMVKANSHGAISCNNLRDLHVVTTSFL